MFPNPILAGESDADLLNIIDMLFDSPAIKTELEAEIDAIEWVPEDSNPLPQFMQMTGTFADWTLADAKWYFERLGWQFVIDGDRERIFGIQ